jgi:hypothetical protein
MYDTCNSKNYNAWLIAESYKSSLLFVLASSYRLKNSKEIKRLNFF